VNCNRVELIFPIFFLSNVSLVVSIIEESLRFWIATKRQNACDLKPLWPIENCFQRSSASLCSSWDSFAWRKPSCSRIAKNSGYVILIPLVEPVISLNSPLNLLSNDYSDFGFRDTGLTGSFYFRAISRVLSFSSLVVELKKIASILRSIFFDLSRIFGLNEYFSVF